MEGRETAGAAHPALDALLVRAALLPDEDVARAERRALVVLEAAGDHRDAAEVDAVEDEVRVARGAARA